MAIIIYYFIFFLSIVLTVSIYEYTKILTSYFQGNKELKNNGSLIFNPKKYIEPFGLMLFLIYKVGWSKENKISSLNYKNRNKSEFLVYLIPMLVTFFLGILLRNIYIHNIFTDKYISIFIETLSIALINISLINLIPIYPFNGEKIFSNILPYKYKNTLQKYTREFQSLFIMLLIFGFITMIFDYTNIIINSILKIIK